ncbi:MAG: prefoldin subunit beta [Desulfurococcales archaeon ex4484_42]|nr:MAG: prefoldin subunit beta [Desulfurococcales archaeon ex4484_42]
MAQKLPPELEKLIIRYQQIESQLASIVTQKSVVTSQMREVERALSILQNLEKDAVIYKSTGFILVKVKKEDVIKELEDKKEELSIRLTSLERMESTLKKQLEEVKSQIDKYRTSMVGMGGKAG